MKKYLLTLLSAFFVLSVWAQNRTVSGQVTDAENGDTVPGANVIEKGTTNGTTTDLDGNFSLSVSDGATLVVSFVGYRQTEVVVGSRSVIDVALELDVAQLSEVVVVGYASQEKKEITSAVVQVDEEAFNRGNVNDAASLLQGKVPGLSIYNKGGDPNATPTIRLRGISTIGANTEPLIVIDGVIGASLDNVDPNDIESMSVLKDGSAAAIYGSRGSSGVIIVTTKTGGSGKAKVTYNGYVAAASILNEIDVMTPAEYTAAGGNDLGFATDWQDEVTRTGVSQVHNIAVSGGNESTSYRISTNIRDINGILNESGFDQINARANLQHRALNDRLSINFNMSLTRRESNFSFNEALRYAALYNPTAPIRNDNGSFFQAVLFDNFNPVAIVEQNQNLGENQDLNFNVKADYEIVDGLTVSANLAQQYETILNSEFYPSTSFFRGQNAIGLARRFTENKRFSLFEAYATYSGGAGNVEYTVTAGYSFQEDELFNYTTNVDNFPSDILGGNNLGLSANNVGEFQTNQGDLISSFASPENRIIAGFARFNLTFDNAIFVNGSVRREGSTRLGADNQWGTFPALGVGVDLNNYLQLTGVSQLKVRAGFGVTGSLPRDAGVSQDLWNYSTAGGGAYALGRLGNPDLGWEEKTEINFGIDFGILDGRLTGALDLYTRTIDDFILFIVADATTGTGNNFQNAGEIQTNGAEISLNYDAVRTPDFTWNTGIVASTYQSTLEDYIIEVPFLTDRSNLGAPGQNSTRMIRANIGEEIGQIWGPRFGGVDENGAPIFLDLNGDGQVVADQGDALSENGDFEELGNGLPDLEIGWTNQLTYKNWDFNAFFRAAFGHSLVNTFRAFYEPIDPGAINSYNRVKSDKSVEGLTVSRFSDLYVENANFFRLDNATLGYKFNTANISGIDNIRVYLNVQNAFILTGYSGIDPDPVLQDFGTVDNGGRQDLSNPDPLSPGIDRRNNYFTARTFTFGLNLGF